MPVYSYVPLAVLRENGPQVVKISENLYLFADSHVIWNFVWKDNI